MFYSLSSLIRISQHHAKIKATFVHKSKDRKLVNCLTTEINTQILTLHCTKNQYNSTPSQANYGQSVRPSNARRESFSQSLTCACSSYRKPSHPEL